MVRLKQTLIIALFAFNLSAQAITFEEFIASCEAICKVEPIKLSSDTVPQLKEEKVDNLVIFKEENISIETKQKVIDAVSSITNTAEMLVVKHNEDDAAVQVFILPQEENVEILVTIFDDNDGVIVYAEGSIELLQQDNLVNIGGKDLIKEALKKGNNN